MMKINKEAVTMLVVMALIVAVSVWFAGFYGSLTYYPDGTRMDACDWPGANCYGFPGGRMRMVGRSYIYEREPLPPDYDRSAYDRHSLFQR